VRDTHTGWYLVLTKPNQENTAKLNLERQGFSVYSPTITQLKHKRNIYQMITEPLFPRYIFIHLDSKMEDWSKIRSTRGCVTLVRFGMLPARIPESLIETLKADEANRLTQAPPKAPSIKMGDHVRIVGGILKDYEGIVQATCGQKRIILLLTIAEGHTQGINLSINDVRIAN